MISAKWIELISLITWKKMVVFSFVQQGVAGHITGNQLFCLHLWHASYSTYTYINSLSDKTNSVLGTEYQIFRVTTRTEGWVLLFLGTENKIHVSPPLFGCYRRCAYARLVIWAKLFVNPKTQPLLCRMGQALDITYVLFLLLMQHAMWFPVFPLTFLFREK